VTDSAPQPAAGSPAPTSASASAAASTAAALDPNAAAGEPNAGDRASGMYYDEKRQFLMVEGVIARGIPTFPLMPRPKRRMRVEGEDRDAAATGVVPRAAAFDGLGGNTTLGIHLSEVPAGGEKQGHRHLDEATFYIVSGHGWTELRQGEDVPDQRVDWAAGDIVTIPSNAWHKHYNASADEPALQIAFKNTRWLRKLFHSREFVYANDFRFPDRYNDEPDYWTAREAGNYGKVRANYLANVVAEDIPADPEAGEGVSIGRYSMGGHRTLDHFLFGIAVGGHVREHRPLAEEAFLVLQGSGRTTLRSDDGRTESFEWTAGDLIAPPFNTFRRHENTGDVPVRYWLVKNNFIERALGVKGNTSLDGAFPDRWPAIVEADKSVFQARGESGGEG
jgi:quercetin dioxygenase-like cupin family protein